MQKRKNFQGYLVRDKVNGYRIVVMTNKVIFMGSGFMHTVNHDWVVNKFAEAIRQFNSDYTLPESVSVQSINVYKPENEHTAEMPVQDGAS